MNCEEKSLRQAKEVCELLGINNERLKYFKKKGIFVSETNKPGYTEDDIIKLKQIVVLTKAGLTCDDISKLYGGEATLQDLLTHRRSILNDKLEQIKGALKLSEELLENENKNDDNSFDKYFDEIKNRESMGERFMDFNFWESNSGIIEDIVCPVCGLENTVDLEDYAEVSYSEKIVAGMNPLDIQTFDTGDEYECPFCKSIIRINGWKGELEIGDFNDVKINFTIYKEKVIEELK